MGTAKPRHTKRPFNHGTRWLAMANSIEGGFSCRLKRG